MAQPTICETCDAVKRLISSMFSSGRWTKTGSTQSCESPDCEEPVALETQLCTKHALDLVDRSAIFTPVRRAVEKTLNKISTAAIRTPKEASEFLSDPQRGYDGMTLEEAEFLTQMKDQGDVYFTDTESAGESLLQVAVVDSKGVLAFGGHINHGCKTVQAIWDLALERNNGKLNRIEECCLRRAFGPPSSKEPPGHTMQWVADQFQSLKERAPKMKIAEWSLYPHDEVVYRENLDRAGCKADEVLPPPSNWVSPMTWFQRTGPALAGHSLGYVACLYAPSVHVWGWHDAVIDAKMLFGIMKTRCEKFFERQVTVSAPTSIERLFEGVTPGDNGSCETIGWIKPEQDLCYRYIEEQLGQNPSIALWELLTGASYYMNSHGYFRTAHAINLHLRKAVLNSKAHSREAHILPLFRDAFSSKAWSKRTTYRRLAAKPEVNVVADAIVQDLYKERDPNGSFTAAGIKSFWNEARRRVHARVQDHPGLTTQDVDLALLVAQNRQATNKCIDCGRYASVRERCHRCRARKAGKICIACKKPTNSMSKVCHLCIRKLKPRNPRAVPRSV